MKNLLPIAILSLFAAAAIAQQQSLGDVARANRAKQRATATTNLNDDNFARSNAPTADSAASKEKAADSKAAPATGAKKDSTAPQNDRLKGQIDAQKKEVATLQRELDIAERETKLRD